MIPLGILATTAGGAAAGAYELISTTILGSDTNNIEFTSIAQTYKHLQIRATTRESSATIGANFNVRMNGITSSSYSHHRLSGNGSSVSSSNFANASNIIMHELPYSGSTSGIFSSSIIDILDYASTAKNKTIRALTGATPADTGIKLVSGVLYSTSAITSVTLYTTATSFLTGSRFSLYGIKGA